MDCFVLFISYRPIYQILNTTTSGRAQYHKQTLGQLAQVHCPAGQVHFPPAPVQQLPPEDVVQGQSLIVKTK